MCGIVGCVGHENALEFVARGLETLEYRGYDSMGIAYPEAGSDQLQVVRSLGGIAALQQHFEVTDPFVTTAMGHSRWATHGAVTTANAHPQTNAERTIAVVHNGTIENHAELRGQLQAEGYVFTSQTDTEVVPHLIDHFMREGQDPDEAFTKAIRCLRGAYAVLALFADYPESMYTARLSSPLVLGVNGSEHFAASDPSVLVDNTKRAIFPEDYEIARLGRDGYRTWHLNGGDTTRPGIDLSGNYERAVLGEFPHFMLKEISETPQTVRSAISGRILAHENLVKLGGLQERPEIREKLRQMERLVIVACGTSYHAGLIGERLIEEVAGVPVEVHLASEFKYRKEPFDAETVVMAISQSGETADTNAAITKAKELGLLTLGINNTPGSTLDRITDAGVHCRAGQEVSVASTKAFVSQVAVLAATALAINKHPNKLQAALMDELVALPGKIESILQDTSAIEAAAKKYAEYRNFLYIGRGYELPSALEGALKLKEISYIHAEGCGAGEMKHGTLALIDEDFPTFAIATDSEVYEKTVSNIEEIRARRGPVLALATQGNERIRQLADDVLYVPASLEQTQPILNAIVMQLFAYYVAVEKDLNVDRPRNLAKSVTVE